MHSQPPLFFSFWIINPYESCHHDWDRLWNCLIMLIQAVTSFGDSCLSCNIFKDNWKLVDVTDQTQPPQQQGRWLLQGELCIPCGDWGELTWGEKTPTLSSLSFHGSLTSHSVKHFSWERDKQVSASYFEGQGGCQSNLCYPKQNILMCLENKKPQLESKPHRANCSPRSEMMLLCKTGDFIRKTQT